jgi:serine/threonine-protein kinase RIO1
MTKKPFFEPSVQVTLEEHRILENLNSFYHDNIITNVLYRLKGGKEANVYCCAAHPSTGLDLPAAVRNAVTATRWARRPGLRAFSIGAAILRLGRRARQVRPARR